MRRLRRGLLFRRTGYAPAVLLAVFLHVSTVALAYAPGSGQPLTALPAGQSSTDQRPTLSLPAESRPCSASGPGAACEATMTALLTPGQPSLPGGLAQCPADPAKSDLRTPAACDDSTLPSPASTVAASNASGRRTRVMPSVPQSTLHPAAIPAATLALTADRTSLRSGESVVLTATATSSVTGTASAIEIFDQTTATLAGACMQSSRCLVGYSATSGAHSFTAFTTAPTMAAPAPGSAITSNSIQVSWIDVTLSAGQPAVVGPGKAVALTASTSVDVGRLGLVLLLWDLTNAAALTYCSRGTSCSTMLAYQTAGSHHIVALVADSASATPGSGVRATSNAAVLTWLSVALVANTTYPQAGGTVNLTAVANVDLTGTPWSLGILDQGGMLVDKACKTGSACSARVTLIGGATPYFSAVIGTAPAAVDAPTMADQWLRRVTDHAPLGDIQVRSAWVQPTRILWGVDSCKPMTGDANGAGGLYPQVASILGSPDFWGRYLTTTGNCPGISSAEVAAAARNKVGILPIYNDYDCSAVSSSDTGQAYADAATSAAENLGIPKRTVIMIDIEPPGYWCSGAVDSGFVKGWYFGVSAAGYSPGFYGDGTSWSTFGQAFCGAVADQAVIGARSYLWSFEPSLITSYPKASAPPMGAVPGRLCRKHGRLAVRAERGRQSGRRQGRSALEASALVPMSHRGGESATAVFSIRQPDRGLRPSERLCCETMTLRERVIPTNRASASAISE